MMLSTRLCRDLGIELPIVSAPFGGGSAGPELASAVSNAGGLGLLGMGGVPAPLIRQEIRETRVRTSKPFGVGLLLPFVQGDEVEVCCEEHISVLVLFWGDPRPHVEKAKRAGIPVFVQVGSVDEAKDAAAAGASAVIAQGFEAGGHVRGTTSLSALLPAVVAAVKPLPVIAAGGIANGRGVVAALTLGAEAVMMGTRFVCSEESRASRAYKERIVRARAGDTVHTRVFDVGWPDAAHRVLRNKAIEQWEAAGRPPSGKRPGEGEIVGRMTVAGAMTDVPRYFVGNPGTDFDGDLEYVALYAGESCDLVHDVKPAATIVRDVVREAGEVVGKLTGSANPADRNDAMVREFLAAWERRDTEHIMACWAEDGVYHAMPRRPIVGRAAFREFVTRFEQVPGGRLEIHHQVATDDVVMNERTDRITFRGRQIVLPICAVFEIRNGRIAAWREYFDPALFTSP